MMAWAIPRGGPRKARLIALGISDKDSFDTACRSADIAIIGSAFIKELMRDAGGEAIEGFVKSVKRKAEPVMT